MTSHREEFERIYSSRGPEAWSFHQTSDPLTRYLRDRRLSTLLELIEKFDRRLNRKSSVLVTCGGVGGEATFFRNNGFDNVISADFSIRAVELCRVRAPDVAAVVGDAEHLPLQDASVDLVLVQDGLHELRSPALGLCEMLRVARLAVGVIEPHTGLVGKLLGTKWEQHNDAASFVFRWNRNLLEQTSFSYLSDRGVTIQFRRIWDHNKRMAGAVSRLPAGRVQLLAARLGYGTLGFMLPKLGNMMVGLIVKPS